ncbi:MAG: tetratricopeptide repeat protein [Planctomycetota bacterium]
MNSIHADEFLTVVAPALERGDPQALGEAVGSRWQPAQVCLLLTHTDPEVRRTAVVTLGIVGGRGEVGALTRCLRDADDQVYQFAEDALWSIWFRTGHADAAALFREGMLALTRDELAEAASRLTAATERDPEFAEAYNQLAIVHYLAGHWEASQAACRRALLLMPTHFGAMAGLGHCYVHHGELRQAIDCYRRALAINPRMPAIVSAKQRLESQLAVDPHAGLANAETDGTVLLDFQADPARSR